jgi:hypothetical protein
LKVLQLEKEVFSGFWGVFFWAGGLVTGIEPRVLYMLGKHSTTWAIVPNLCFLSFWVKVSLTLSGLTSTSWSSCFQILSNCDYSCAPPG